MRFTDLVLSPAPAAKFPGDDAAVVIRCVPHLSQNGIFPLIVAGIGITS
jgi:hypothetical protein